MGDVLRSHLLLVRGVVGDMAEKLEPETIDRVLAHTVHVREAYVYKLARHEARIFQREICLHHGLLEAEEATDGCLVLI